MNKSLLLLPLFLFCSMLQAQDYLQDSVINYSQEPTEYEIGEIVITGNDFTDEKAISVVSGLKVGDIITIPGDKISNSIKALWRQKLFTDIQIVQTKVIDQTIFLEIRLKERPRLSRYTFRGVPKSTHETLGEEVEPYLLKGGIVTEASRTNAITTLKKHYYNKGFFDTEITVEEQADTKFKNAVQLIFDIKKNDKVKIKDITFSGNKNVKDKKLRKQMENTKVKRKFLASSKLVANDYSEDKKAIINYYNTIGYRDSRVLGDSIWRNENGDLRIHIDLEEGNQYYFRNITWRGNSLHSDAELSARLGIEKGDIYNEELLQQKLVFSQDGRDVSALYQDDGYLFFRVDPIEVAIENDSIDLEMRIFEGPQATIDRVIIRGNDRTHEHVIRRELRTQPGDKFSRSDLIRSQRQIINLGYFNQENLQVNTPVNPNRGTVDIEYVVEERSSDQLELSAGYQPATIYYRGGLIGTLGVTFNNFSLRNIFNTKAWDPLPMGDGQRLSIRAQTNGKIYKSYNFSFTEPWLGGKKPNSFTLGGYFTENGSIFQENRKFSIAQVSLGHGSRLSWPDDNFVTNTSLNFQNIQLNSFPNLFVLPNGTTLGDGRFNNFYLQQSITRATIADPIYPKDGSEISLSVQLTPPYSLLGKKDYGDLPPQEKYRWVEYHKWRFKADWYATIVGNLVLKTSAKFGMLGRYSKEVGDSPFERFELGAPPLSNQYTITGKDQITARGYEIADFPAVGVGGASIFNKYTIELRYALSLNPTSTIYVLGFLEGSNAWNSFSSFNPFNVKRSAGMGLRVFLPMFGTLGFDYGLGFDKPNVLSNPDRTFKDFGVFQVILGFEPE